MLDTMFYAKSANPHSQRTKSAKILKSIAHRMQISM